MAHQYPPAPFFGQFPPATYYPPQIQHPSQLRPPPGGYQPNLQNPAAPQPYFHPPRLDGQPPIPSPNPFPQFPPASFNPDMFRHFATSNPPPPPPLSLPSGPYPTNGFIPYPHQHPFPQQYPQSQNVPSFDGSLTSRMWAPVNSEQGKNHTEPSPRQPGYPLDSEIADNAIEEGSLSDGEIDGSADALVDRSSRTISQDDATMPLPSDKRNSQHNRLGAARPRLEPTTTAVAIDQPSPATKMSLRANGLANDSRMDVEVTLSDGGDSAASYNPPSASTPGSVHRLLENLQTQASDSESGQNLSLSGPTMKHPNKSASQMRELAKGALLSLAPHNIRLRDLVEEGIDGRILHELYNELGMKDTNISSPALTQKSSQRGSLALAADLNSKHSQLPVTKPGNVSQTKSLPLEHISGLAAASIAPSAPSAHPSRILGGTDAKQIQLLQPVLSPLLERKDRIAQLLAAKTGKLPPNRITSETPSPVLAEDSILSVRSTSIGAGEGPQATVPLKGLTSTESPGISLRNSAVSLKTKQSDVVPPQLDPSSSLQQARKIAASFAGLGGSAKVEPPASTREEGNLPASELFEKGRALLALPEPLEMKGKNPEAAKSESALLTSSLIPGLFMTSADYQRSEVAQSQDQESCHSDVEIKAAQSQYDPTDPSTGIVSWSERPETLRRLQKRPLAADSFDQLPQRPIKRPFEREDVSNVPISFVQEHPNDDVSEGEIMEIDGEPEVSMTADLPAPSSGPIGSFEPTASAPLSYAASEYFPSTVQSSPPRMISSTPNSVNAVSSNLWLAKNQEIEAMRRKIAEAEERQKLKKSQSQMGSSFSSGQNTPVLIRAIPPLALHSSPEPSENIPPALGDFRMKAAALKAEVLRKQSLRRQTLQEGMPDLCDQVEKTQSKLAETQAKLAKLKAEDDRREAERLAAVKEQEALFAEAFRLEAQLKQGINGQNRYSEELKHLEGDSETKLSAGNPVFADPEAIESPSSNHQSPSLPVESSHGGHRQQNNDLFDPVDAIDSPIPSEQLDAETESINEAELGELSAENVLDSVTTKEFDATKLVPDVHVYDRADKVAEISSFSPGNQDNEVLQPSLLVAEGKAEQDESDFIADQDSTDQGQSPMDLDDESDGSASMSDSASEAFQSDDDQVHPLEDDSDEYDPEAATIPVQAPSLQVEEDADEYEPAEIVDLHETTKTWELKPELNEPAISIRETMTEPHDGAHESQLTKKNALIEPQEVPVLVNDAVTPDIFIVPSEPSTRFFPYHSPLASLKSFRFNPTYNERVGDGYRSLTYSYNIDPTRPLCPTELAGETCSDLTCEEQHFGQMTLADSKILEQLASAHDLTDKAQRDRFLAGMKHIIADLRIRKVKEFNEVADELAAYRRRFREEQNPALLAPPS